MLLLSQTLTSLEKQQILYQAVEARNNYHLAKSSSLQSQIAAPMDGEQSRMRSEARIPISMGDQAVPDNDPGWDPDKAADEWVRNYFIYCILEGLRRVKVKPFNYSQVTAVHQELTDPPLSPHCFSPQA
jgi:hypothetical protein